MVEPKNKQESELAEIQSLNKSEMQGVICIQMEL